MVIMTTILITVESCCLYWWTLVHRRLNGCGMC